MESEVEILTRACQEARNDLEALQPETFATISPALGAAVRGMPSDAALDKAIAVVEMNGRTAKHYIELCNRGGLLVEAAQCTREASQCVDVVKWLQAMKEARREA